MTRILIFAIALSTIPAIGKAVANAAHDQLNYGENHVEQ